MTAPTPPLPDFQELLAIGFTFHGHRCPAMPLGLRAGLHALSVLGVPRAPDKELHLISETGRGHAAGCFLDGLMVATGCTYGKGNIEKRYWNQLAFTLVDVKGQRAVRLALKPSFVESMMRSPFVEQRRRGVAPQDVPPEVLDPLLERVLALEIDDFLLVGPIQPYELRRPPSVFETATCERCGERVFVSGLRDTEHGRICGHCREQLGIS